MSELDELRARMAALEEMVRDLRVELATSLAGRFRSMRDSRRCPACGGEHLLHIPRALEKADHGSTTPLAVHHERGFWSGGKQHGPIEHFVCRRCLLVESHAIDLEGVEPDGKHVIAIEPDPTRTPDTPFR